jgi:hypothetical protein
LSLENLKFLISIPHSTLKRFHWRNLKRKLRKWRRQRSRSKLRRRRKMRRTEKRKEI